MLTEEAEKAHEAATLRGESPALGTTSGHSVASSRAMIWTYLQESLGSQQLSPTVVMAALGKA